MTLIISFSGRAGVGKTWAARQLVARGCEHISFAAPLRRVTQLVWPDIAAAVAEYGYAEAKNRLPDMRARMQALGGAVRTLEPNPWLTTAISAIRRCNMPVVIDDCRYPSEAEALAEIGAIFLHIDGDGSLDPKSPEYWHDSEGYCPPGATRYLTSTDAARAAVTILEGRMHGQHV